jgi:Flp pilus assembly protein TadB
MAARRRHVGPAPFVVTRKRGPRVVSVKELRWNARLGVVTQLVYLLGKLPRAVRLGAVVAVLAAVWLAVELVVAWWPVLLALLVLLVLYRLGRPRLAWWLQYRRDRDSVPF